MAKEKDGTNLEELLAELEKQKEAAEYYKKLYEEGGGSQHKTEAVRELFDFPRSKLPQRTRLNEKEILTLTNLKTNMQMLDPKEERLYPEAWMDNLMEMKISLRGKGRDEGMGIFQLAAERAEGDEGYKVP